MQHAMRVFQRVRIKMANQGARIGRLNDGILARLTDTDNLALGTAGIATGLSAYTFANDMLAEDEGLMSYLPFQDDGITAEDVERGAALAASAAALRASLK